jgi:hypothetical protein
MTVQMQVVFTDEQQKCLRGLGEHVPKVSNMSYREVNRLNVLLWAEISRPDNRDVDGMMLAHDASKVLEDAKYKLRDLCTSCKVTDLPDRLGPDHIAMRFDVREASQCRAYLEGDDVSNDCTEAYPGDPGFVILHRKTGDNKFAACPDCGSSISYRTDGLVRIERMDKVPA